MKQQFNDTSLFLLPCLQKDADDLVTRYGFINGYLKDDVATHDFENCIYLLFKPSSMEIMQAYIDQEYLKKCGIISDYDHSGGFVVLVYKIPDLFKKDHDRFLKGKYSKFSVAFKNLLPAISYEKDGSSGVNIPVASIQYLVVNKVESIRKYWQERLEIELGPEDEYWSKPKMSRETITLKKLSSIIA